MILVRLGPSSEIGVGGICGSAGMALEFQG